MPIYEYFCQECEKVHEIMQKITDRPLKKCPSCGGKMEKKLSLAGFHLKGGGWYKDGYSSVNKSSSSSASSTSNPSDTSNKGKSEPTTTASSAQKTNVKANGK